MTLADTDQFDTLDPDRPLTVQSFGLTHLGRVRDTNEDHFVIAELQKVLRVQMSSQPAESGSRCGDEVGYIFLVADGIGGHRGGEYASNLAAQTVEEFLLNTLKWFFRVEGEDEQHLLDDLRRSLQRADDRVIHEAKRRPALRGMGTTLTMGFTLRNELFVLHAGDSRCYLWRDSQLRQLTRDHTFAAALLEQGCISAEEAAKHPYRHVLTNAVGGDNPGVEVEIHQELLRPGDGVLLCSDGLTDMVPHTEITAVLKAEKEPKSACERLVAMANDAGGKDNITVVLARFS